MVEDRRDPFLLGLTDRDRNVQLQTLETLLGFKERRQDLTDLLPEMHKLLYQADSEIRWAAAMVLVPWYGQKSMNWPAYRGEIEALRQGTAKEKIAALDSLGLQACNPYENSYERDISFAVPPMALLLDDPDTQVRKLALENLSVCISNRWGAGYAIPAIMAVLGDEQRADLHEGVAKIVWEGTRFQNIDIGPYIRQLSDLIRLGVGSVKKHLVKALTHYFGSAKKWGRLKDLLQDEDREVRLAAAETLSRSYVRRLSPVIKTLMDMLQDESMEVRRASAATLAADADEPEQLVKTLDFLAEELGSDDPQVKKDTLRAIERSIECRVHCSTDLDREHWSLYAEVIELLRKLYRKRGDLPKAEIARTLTRYYVHIGDFEKPLRFLSGRHIATKVQVLSELRGCDDRCRIDFTPVIPKLLQVAAGDANAKVRLAASKTLETYAERRKPDGTTYYRELVENDLDINDKWGYLDRINRLVHRDEPRALNERLRTLDGPAKVERLTGLLAHPEPFVRAWAAHNLYDLSHPSWTGRVPICTAVALLIGCLRDPDRSVRLEAVQALAHTADCPSIGDAIPNMTGLLDDDLIELRRMTLWSLNMLVGAGRDITGALASVRRALVHDRSRDVRCAAAMLLYEAAAKRVDLSGAVEELIDGLSDKYDLVSTYCSWILARFLLDRPLAERLLEEIERRGLRKASRVTELRYSCRRVLRDAQT
ncbi:MAG: HEAT repeat domain-containing protein [Bradymonadales bacterium]|nr:HEAT repeat domain-containing protein [Bradymonadales bacterium]